MRVPPVSEVRAFMVAWVSATVAALSCTVGVIGLAVVAAGPGPAAEKFFGALATLFLKISIALSGRFFLR